MGREKLRVGLDVDGVVGDLTTPACVVMSEMLGREFSPAEVVQWDFDHALPVEQRRAFWERIGAPGFCRAIPPYPDAVEAVRRLEEVADVYLVTSPLPSGATWTHERNQWAVQHFGIPHRRIVHTHSKHVFAADMLIDDRASNVAEWAREHPGCPVLWAQPYNERHEISASIAWRVLRTSRWDDVLARLDQMASGIITSEAE